MGKFNKKCCDGPHIITEEEQPELKVILSVQHINKSTFIHVFFLPFQFDFISSKITTSAFDLPFLYIELFTFKTRSVNLRPGLEPRPLDPETKRTINKNTYP